MKNIKQQKVAVTILREKPLYEGDPVTLSWQKRALERYCNDKKIKIQDYHYADESYVHWGDFRTFLKSIEDKSFKPDVVLFTSWEIIAPLLDRFPKTFKVLADKGIRLVSIQKHIIKHAMKTL
jgi:hypothetical protein